MKLFLKCEEAAHICDKSQYKEANFFERLILKIHLLVCNLCRGYSKNNAKLTHSLKEANISTLAKAEKEQLKTTLLCEIEKLTKI